MKTCEHCHESYTQKPHQTRREFAESRYCSRGCSSRASAWITVAKQRQRRLDILEDVEWIIDSDSPENVAHRLGYKNVGVLIRLCDRWERPDLAARLRHRLEVAA